MKKTILVLLASLTLVVLFPFSSVNYSASEKSLELDVSNSLTLDISKLEVGQTITIYGDFKNQEVTTITLISGTRKKVPDISYYGSTGWGRGSIPFETSTLYVNHHSGVYTAAFYVDATGSSSTFSNMRAPYIKVSLCTLNSISYGLNTSRTAILNFGVTFQQLGAVAYSYYHYLMAELNSYGNLKITWSY